MITFRQSVRIKVIFIIIPTNSRKRFFLPPIVDKRTKRAEIAGKCSDLFIEKGCANLTVSEAAKAAGIGKGTVYDYFDSKEDIVFEIMKETQKRYDLDILAKIKKAGTPKEKVMALFDLCILQDPETVKRRKIFKEFLLVCRDRTQEEISCVKIDSKRKYIELLEEIIEEGIRSNILKKEAHAFVEGLFLLAEGYLILSNDEDSRYDGDVLITHINALFGLLEQ